MDKNNDMGKSCIHHILISCTLLVFFMIGLTSGDDHKSLRLTMVRKDSLFPDHLSAEEKDWRMVHLSRNRSHYFNYIAAKKAALLNKNRTSTVGPDAILRPYVAPFASSIYAVFVGIGTQPYLTYLDIDTGSDFTWVQCTNCDKCFAIKNGPFAPELSNTYAPLSWDDPLCQPPDFERQGDACYYRISYVDGKTVGEVARETLTFGADNGGGLSISQLVLGCATVTDFSFGENEGPDNVLSGIFGLATGPTAFLNIAGGIVGNRFSYCLPRWNAPRGSNTFLRFGNDIPALPAQYQSTPMETDRYYVRVEDITICNTPLGLNPEVYRRRPDGTGGFAIDSGSGNTLLVEPVFERVKAIVTGYFYNSYGLAPLDTKAQGIPYDLCYEFPVPEGVVYPSMTYHFEGADLVLDGGRIFQVLQEDFLCMIIISTAAEGVNLLGAAQQADNRFIFDLGNERLYFFPENCLNG